MQIRDYLVHQQIQISKTTLNIDGHILKWQPNVKYLGVILDRKTNWAAHTKMTRDRARLAAKIIWPLTRPPSSLAPTGRKNNSTVYKMLVKPILAYGAPTWLPYASSTNLISLERVQSKTLRQISQPPPGTSNETIQIGLGIDSLLDSLNNQTNNFKNKCRTNRNPLIQQHQWT